MNFQLTIEQNAIVNSKSKILIIDGPKNTGKSIAGLSRAVHLAENNENVLYLTFTKRAARELNKKLNLSFNNFKEKVQIINIDKVLMNIYLNSIDDIVKNIIMPNEGIVNNFINDKINEDDNITAGEVIIQISKIIDEDYLTLDDYLQKEMEINNITKKKKIWFIFIELKEFMKEKNYIFLLDLYKEILKLNKEIKIEYKTKNYTFRYNHIIIDNIEDLSQTRYNLLKEIFRILFYKKNYSITLIGDLNAETFLHSYGIKEKLQRLKTSKHCESFELQKNIKSTNIEVAEKLAEEYDFLDKNTITYEKITTNDISVYFIDSLSCDKEYKDIEKIITYLKTIGYSYKDINIISFSNNSLDNLKDIFDKMYNIPIYYDNQRCYDEEHDLNGLQSKKRNKNESFENYKEMVEITTAHRAQKNLENKVIILFNTITLDCINAKDVSDEMEKKRMILLYETLYTATDLLFVFGNNNKDSCINKLNKKYMECVEKVEDISLFDGIAYLEELSLDEYIKKYFGGSYDKFEKYCNQPKQHVIFDISDAYKNE